MVNRFLNLRNLGTVVAVCVLTNFCLHANSYGQIVGSEEEVTPAEEAPPSDSAEPNPTEAPQVVPEGEQPEAPEPNKEDLICGTLEDGLTSKCPETKQLFCKDTGKCINADDDGNRRCKDKFVFGDPLKKPREVVVHNTGKIGTVPREITEGAAKVFLKSELKCYQEFSCALNCIVNEEKGTVCVRGIQYAVSTRFKFSEVKEKSCSNGEVNLTPKEEVVPAPDEEADAQK